MFTAEQIADHILNEAPYGLTNRELQKLLYYVQGFYLAQTGEVLFNDSIYAWKFGPVNNAIWHKFKHLGYTSILGPTGPLAPLDAKAATLIAAVVLSFGALGQLKLIEYSHADRPWAQQYIPSSNQLIKRESLKDYFAEFQGIDDYLGVAKQKYDFHVLIKQRIEYLINLPAIGADWISGGSASPSYEVCALTKDFLSGLERYTFASENRPDLPKIVMGPLPSGGVGLELRANSKALYVNLWNSGLVEIDTESKSGEFTSAEISSVEFEEDFSEYYKVLTA